MSVAKAGRDALPLLRYLASLGLRDFGSVRTLHLSNHIADLRQRLQPSSVRGRLTIIDLVWVYSEEVFHPLQSHPWAGISLRQACGCNDEEDGPSGRTGKTAVIPRSVQRTLFTYCEAHLSGAEKLFRASDAAAIYTQSHQLTTIRDAVLYLLQVTSRMRNSESMGIKANCWRMEVKNGVNFHWVRTREIKTGRGEVEFFVPPEAIEALKILQRYAAPLQARLVDEARWLEDQLRQVSSVRLKVEQDQLVSGIGWFRPRAIRLQGA